MELDDTLRLMHVLRTWNQSPENTRPRLIIIAGERNGGKSTFEEVVALTGCRTYDSNSNIAEDGEVVVLRGIPLKSDSANSSDVSFNLVIERLQHALEDRPFVWHNNTSENLFAKLIEYDATILLNCLAHICSCDVVLHPDRLLAGANWKFDSSSYSRVKLWCKTGRVPFISAHGSTLGFYKQGLSDLPDWDDILTVPMFDQEYLREAARFSMQQALQWTVRIYGALRATHGAELANYAYQKVPDHGRHLPWTRKPMQDSTYDADECTLESAPTRSRSIASKCFNPINNTIGDFALTVLDTPKLIDTSFLPVNVDLRAGEVDFCGSNTGHFLMVAASEAAVLENFRALLQSCGSTQGTEATVDRTLASEWKVFCSIMITILDDIAEFGSNISELDTLNDQARKGLREGAMSKASGTILND